jgi:putative endonuclease
VSDVIPNCRDSGGEEPAVLLESDTMPEDKLYYVYILSSKSRAIYVGITAFLMNRVLSHRAGEASDFTRKYKISRLVYYEVFHSVAAAIARETEIKKWRREKKVALIVQENLSWEDLAAEWGKPAVMRVEARAGSSPPLRAGSE